MDNMYNNAMAKQKNKLVEEQRKLSSMSKNTDIYRKQEIKIYKVKEKIENIMKGVLHIESRRIVESSNNITIESLKEITTPFNLYAELDDVEWSIFLNMIDYKLRAKGRKLT